MGFHPADIPGLLPDLLRGLGITVLASVVIMAIAMVLALPVALARMSRNQWPCYYHIAVRDLDVNGDFVLLSAGESKYQAIRVARAAHSPPKIDFDCELSKMSRSSPAGSV